MKKRSTSDLTGEQRYDRKVDYGALGDVAVFFEIHKIHIGMRLTPVRFILIYNPTRREELASNSS